MRDSVELYDLINTIDYYKKRGKRIDNSPCHKN